MSDNRGNLSRPHFEARYTDTAIAKADKSVCVAVIVTQYDINLKYADAVGVGDLRVISRYLDRQSILSRIIIIFSHYTLCNRILIGGTCLQLRINLRHALQFSTSSA